MCGGWNPGPLAVRPKPTGNGTVDHLRQHLGHRDTLPKFGDRSVRALALRVHPTIPLTDSAGSDMAEGGLDPDLPAFVERDKGEEIRNWMRKARIEGGFLVLAGDSSVGKTRLLYETAREVFCDFDLLAPDLGDGGLVNTFAESTFPLPKQLVVWLDELQRFLDGPYLTDGSTAITGATVRKLLDAPTPVILLGTLWPKYATELRTTER